MKKSYKNDIIEKLLELYVLFYFVFGIVTTFVLGCKNLDKLSSNNEILSFWEPIAVVYGLLYFVNFCVNLFCLFKNKKYPELFLQMNEESDMIFHILSIPLFFITMLHLCWRFIESSEPFYTISQISKLIVSCDILFFIGTIILIKGLSQSRRNIKSLFQFQINKFALSSSLVGLVNYSIYHIVDLQVEIFIKIASNCSSFNPFYTEHNRFRTASSIYYLKLQQYIQPLIIIWCICCISYIIILIKANNEEKDIFQKKCIETEQVLDEIENERMCTSISLPPLSILLGLMFITITIVILLIVISLRKHEFNINLKYLSDIIITTFPSLLCLISIILMYFQINAMNYWPKRNEKTSLTDKLFLYFGTAGLFMISIAEIKLHISISDKYMSVSIIILSLLIIIQCVFQFVTISLALDREWKNPKIKSWQSVICPTFGLFTINVGFLLIVLYYCKTYNSHYNLLNTDEKRFFMRLFKEEFHSIGVTMMIFARLYSSIIFGKITLFIYS